MPSVNHLREWLNSNTLGKELNTHTSLLFIPAFAMYHSLKVSFLILFCLVRADGCWGDDWPVLGTACHFGVFKNFIHICVPINVCLLTLTYMFMLFSLWLAIGNPCRIVVQPTGECLCKTMSEFS